MELELAGSGGRELLFEEQLHHPEDIGPVPFWLFDDARTRTDTRTNTARTYTFGT